MSTFTEIKKKGKIKLYAKKLPYSLKKRFGRKDHYIQAEVDQALTDNFVDTVSHNEYAYAMFCDQAEFSRIQQAQNTAKEYRQMRNEIATICFRRPVPFSVNEIMEYASGDWGFDYPRPDELETDLAV